MKPAFVPVALAFLFGCCTVGHSDPFPARPVTMIVPFPAGGPTDTLARILAERMRVALGQPIVIENVTGAGASIGVARAAQAAPDGHTLSIGNWTSHVGAGAMYQAAHDAILELRPIGLISAAPLMLVGKTSLPTSDAKETRRLAQGKSRQNVGSNGRSRKCSARLPPLFPAKDGNQLPTCSVSRRGTGDARSCRGAD